MELNNQNVVLLLGSNLGNRLENLMNAQEHLEEMGEIVQKSLIYESDPWGYESENGFVNQVLIIETSIKAENILRKTQEIERLIGREIKSKSNVYNDRIIDIDILFKGSSVIQQANLNIPHPAIQDRKFTLIPLAELIPSFVHPILKMTIQDLLDHCKDKSRVYEKRL